MKLGNVQGSELTSGETGGLAAAAAVVVVLNPAVWQKL